MFLLESDSGSKLCTSRYLQGMNHYKSFSVFLNIKVALFCQILSKKYEVYLLYARHYNPWFVYFLPHFSVRFMIKRG